MFENIRGNKNTIQDSVIAVEPLSETIEFCTAGDDGAKLCTCSANYKVRPFDQEFFDILSSILRQQQEEKTDTDLKKASLILPDQLFLLDLITVPVIHRKAMQHSLSLAVEAIYKNADELKLVTYPIQQNKQTATFGLVGIRWDLLKRVRETFDSNGITVTGVTFASNAMVNGAMALNSKLRGATFLLMDIKENYSRFAFVVRGCTMGYYDLPFGHRILHKSSLVSEDLLFDHHSGELLVLNAKERARAKQLTVDNSDNTALTDGESANYSQTSDSSSHKNARKMPKFMTRPVPQSSEEYLYENFRIFLKWALELINNNREIVSLAKLDTVYVNMPNEYRFLFEIINRKHDGRDLTFAPLLSEGSETSLAENLELYGGFFLNRYNEVNTF